MMLNNGFQRLAECHALLNDDPARVAQYDTIVKTSCTAFLHSLVHYDVDGHDCVKWSYAANDPTLHYMEDAGHGGYDLLLLRHYRSGRYGITKNDLLPLANTIRYVIAKPDGTFATRVDGISKGTPSKSLHTTYLPPTPNSSPDLWPLIAPPELPRASNPTPSSPPPSSHLQTLPQHTNTLSPTPRQTTDHRPAPFLAAPQRSASMIFALITCSVCQDVAAQRVTQNPHERTESTR